MSGEPLELSRAQVLLAMTISAIGAQVFMALLKHPESFSILEETSEALPSILCAMAGTAIDKIYDSEFPKATLKLGLLGMVLTAITGVVIHNACGVSDVSIAQVASECIPDLLNGVR
ncbi:hypothetical protein KC717_05285 [Candidatus Dojkabacteria bacterium]|uniref:Holin n=1 Tax=Candidatus Dojkabacteria bacterium TaxID=2099670 RepID=A0A955L8K9_9BACT|nr:hypothetical protein [Candidatus Dojkabacteria bacterium]